jgi:hypothetical protein
LASRSGEAVEAPAFDGAGCAQQQADTTVASIKTRFM